MITFRELCTIVGFIAITASAAWLTGALWCGVVWPRVVKSRLATRISERRRIRHTIEQLLRETRYRARRATPTRGDRE